MVISLGYVTVPAEHHAQVSQMLSDLAARTRAEQGCLDYRVSHDLEVPGRFTLVETWNSVADMQTHLALPHIGPAVEALHALGARDLSVTAYEAGDPMTML
ncbi:putative quinol monooxygenase [Deinococcus aquiradiocola]|uniref:Antibiotic biosynthesis monooxygenase n=1 Tax=Deinococcus aquiradiocola TaxID=393059 RepID=A0A917PP50_9DEIO|nr:putative quinol monooxygenase [Deinococcus aquiradiocola]GGJ86448.1 antibiotic biosynthesis monooxygenase [Deinococcus aquiradiocola]